MGKAEGENPSCQEGGRRKPDDASPPPSFLQLPSSILHPQISSPPIGLLAGGGRFPIVFAERARSLGIAVVGVGLRDEADPQLARLVQRFDWVSIARLGRMIRCFKRAGVQRWVMAGKV